VKWLIGAVLGLFLGAHSAQAQGRPIVTLTATDPTKWDAAGHIGWRGTDKSGIAAEWNEWASAASFGASFGYHWTAHLKTELDVATTTTSDVYVQTTVVTPPTVVFRSGEYHFHATSLSGVFLYQFGENAWFHPFVGGGVETTRQRSRLDLRGPGCVGSCPPLVTSEAETSYEARPVAVAGFKWYVSERAFIRTDIKTILSTDGAQAVAWRFGIGSDF
jgi:outer membrane protein W